MIIIHWVKSLREHHLVCSEGQAWWGFRFFIFPVSTFAGCSQNLAFPFQGTVAVALFTRTSGPSQSEKATLKNEHDEWDGDAGTQHIGPLKTRRPSELRMAP